MLFSLKSGKREKNTAFLYVFSYLTPLFPRSAAVFHRVSTVKNNAQSPAVIGLPRSSRSPQQKYDRWTLIRETWLVNYFLVIFNFFGNFYRLTLKMNALKRHNNPTKNTLKHSPKCYLKCYPRDFWIFNILIFCNKLIPCAPPDSAR